MNRWGFSFTIWGLVGLLVISLTVLFISRSEPQSFPSTTNVKPSGVAAFAELLRRDGFDVSLNREQKPRLEPDDLVIFVTLPYEPFGAFQDVFDELESEEFEEGPYVSPTEEALAVHVLLGGRVLQVFMTKGFSEASKLSEAALRLSSNVTGSGEYLVNARPYLDASTTLPISEAAYRGWSYPGATFTLHYPAQEGAVVTVADGIGMTNRFLGDNDNAAFYLYLVRQMAGHSKRVVFVEAGIGNFDTTTVYTMLGSWSAAARWQVLLLLAVIIFTFGVRFGLPDRRRSVQRGSRELVEAVATAMRRGKKSGTALNLLLQEVDERIRKATGTPASSDRLKLLRGVPTSLREQYLAVEEMVAFETSASRAAVAAQALLAALEAFEADTRQAQ
ncbi:MAG: hypothetical protein IH944_00335 [Armatimonadetes bacterium]|nr:hypothetical protein [Armatimonadota bacterium]